MARKVEYIKPDPIWRANEWANIHQSEDAMKSFIARSRDFDPDRYDIGPVYFLNTVMKTANPRLPTNKIRPMFLARRQAELIHHIHTCILEGLDSATIKSRYVGGSWCYMGYSLWAFLFQEGFQAHFGSRRDDLVESKGKGNMDALFPKFDFMINEMPRFLQEPLEAEGYFNKQEGYKVEFLRKNPLNGSQLSGEAVTPHFGVAGRAALALIDELSKCKDGEAGWASVAQTAESRHAIFTPNGKNFAYGLIFPEDYAAMMGIDNIEHPEVFGMDYRDDFRLNAFNVYSVRGERGKDWDNIKGFLRWQEEHKHDIIVSGNGWGPGEIIPEKQNYEDDNGVIHHLEERQPIPEMPDGGVSLVYPWRARQGLRYSDGVDEMELDKSFEPKKKGKVYSVQIALSGKKRLRRRPYDPIYVIIDPGRGLGNAFYLAWVQFNSDTLRYEGLMDYQKEGPDTWYFKALVTGREKDYAKAALQGPDAEFERIYEITQNPAWWPTMITGDPNGLVVKASNSPESVRQIMSGDTGIPVIVKPKLSLFANRIPALRSLLPFVDFDMDKAKRTITAIENISWPKESLDQNRTTPVTGWAHHPVFSHGVSAWEFFAGWNPHRYDIPHFNMKITDDGEEVDKPLMDKRDDWYKFDKQGFSMMLKRGGGRFGGRRSTDGSGL